MTGELHMENEEHGDMVILEPNIEGVEEALQVSHDAWQLLLLLSLIGSVRIEQMRLLLLQCCATGSTTSAWCLYYM